MIDVMVAAVLVVAASALVLASTSELQDQMDTCLDKARGMGTALLAYATDHDNLMPGDAREAVQGHTVDHLARVPASEEQFAQSWLAQLEGYMVIGPETLDCPVVDDHRKAEWWPADYVINRWAIGTSTAIAAEPARAMLAVEPNMQRGSVRLLGDIFAWWDWGPRPDLEQNKVGSVSFVFVDGHAARISVAEGDNPQLATYPQIYMAPPVEHNLDAARLWWTEDQTLPSGQ